MVNIIEAEPKPVIIQISYSLLSIHKKGWRIGRQDLSTYRSQLFHPDRLVLREQLFRLVTIPSLQVLCEQELGKNLKVIVYTSADLPSPFLHNLHLLVDELGCGEVIEIEENEKFRYPDVIPRVLDDMFGYDRLKEQQKLNFAAVRLDDDDALPADYIDRLSEYISDSYSGFAVTFGRGYVGQFDSQSQRFVHIQDVYQPMSSRGLAAICTYDMAQKSFCSPCASAFMLGEHPTVDRRYPTIVDAREPGFFASEHAQQDTKEKISLRNLKKLAMQLSFRRKPIEENCINQLSINNTFLQNFGYIPLGISQG
jgi:hypothetical protein